jgi:cysteinyl-tRNA synthetase
MRKALSTSSEEEAVSALRMARKKHTGGGIDFSANEREQAKQEYDRVYRLGVRWMEEAKRYAKKLEYAESHIKALKEYYRLSDQNDLTLVRAVEKEVDRLTKENKELQEKLEEREKGIFLSPSMTAILGFTFVLLFIIAFI